MSGLLRDVRLYAEELSAQALTEIVSNKPEDLYSCDVRGPNNEELVNHSNLQTPNFARECRPFKALAEILNWKPGIQWISVIVFT